MTLRYLIPGLPQPLRLGLFALVEAAGLYVQLGRPGGFRTGTLIMVAGLFLVFARGYRNKPVDLGFEDWQAVTLAEIDRLRDNLERTRTLKMPPSGRSGFPVLVIVGLVFAGFLAQAFRLPSLHPLFFDAFLLLIPFLFTGRLHLWIPRQLKMKLEAFQPLVDHLAAPQRVPAAGAAGGSGAGATALTPYLRLDKDGEGRRIPEDVRLMVEPRRKPADFLGTQIQVAINNGPNGAVPYMYAVFLCRGRGASFEKLMKKSHPRMVKEPGQDEGFAYVVLRQETARGGYYTRPADCRRLLDLVLQEMQAL